MRKTLRMWISPTPGLGLRSWWLPMLLWLASASAWAQTVTVGSTTVPPVTPATSSYFYGPLYRSSNDAGSTFNYSRYAHLYTPAELGIPTGAVITQLEWLKADAGQVTGNNTFNVWLENSSRTTLGTTQTWSALSATATPAYTSTTQQVTGAAGAYFSVTLTQPFTYTGGNLLILTDWEKQGSASAAVNFVTNPATGFGLGYANSAALTGTTALTAVSYGDRRPTLRVTYTPGGPCTAPPTAGTVVASATSACAGSPVSFSLQGASFGTGMTYQWQSSTNGTTFTNISGATSPGYSVASLSATTYFRAVLTCSGQTATTPAVQVTVAAPTYATVPFTESFEATWVDACNTRDVPSNSWRNTPATGNNSWRRNDDGASAAWTSTLGAYTPAASQGSSSARFHSYNSSSGTVGTLDLYANLSTAGNKLLSFDFINTSGTDSLTVHLSTDGGATFGPALVRRTTASTWTTVNVGLPATTSATAIIRFRVRSDFSTTDVGLDNVNLSVLTGVPGCVTNVTPANNATNVGRPLTITWSPGTTGITTGYDVYFGTTATPPLVSSNQSGTSYTPASLAANTTYYYQVVARNANGAATGCAVSQFTTGSTFNYCSSGLGSYCGTADITAVAITGTTLNNAGTTCSVTNGSGYTAYPATGSTTATLSAGTPYQLSVTASASAILSVWVDYNQNGAYEASEWQQITTASTANAPTTITLNVPSNAVQGVTGLRIRSRSQGSPNGATDACTEFFSGETEDYLVTIAPVPACPAVTNLAVTTRTSTSATISFTTPSAGTSYTVTYTAANGTPVTVSPNPTASPITLSGLAPATNYTVAITTNCAGSQTSVTNYLTFVTQIGNDECATAQLLTSAATCSPTNGTVFQASQSTGTIPACNLTSPGTADDDVWYRFVATGAAHDIRLVEGAGFAGVMQLFSGSCGSLTAVQCIGNATANGVEVMQATGLTPNQTYYVRIYSFSGTAPTAANGGFTICVSAPTPPPANDNCATAQVLTPGATCNPTSGSTWLATQSTGTIPTCGLTSPGTADDDVWYSFVATSTGHQIDVDELTGFDAVVQVFSGSCGTLTALQCIDNSSSGGAEQLRVYGLTPNQTYYVRIYSFSATAPSSSDSNFTICVTTAPTPAANDECATATPLTVQFGTACVSPIIGNNINASASANIPAPGCASYSGGDVWYSVVVPATGTLTLETGAGSGSGTSITDTGMAAYSGTCGNLALIECDDDDSPNGLYSKLDLTGLTPGSTIYVRVWEFGNDLQGEFSLCAITPSNCAAPTAPLSTVTSNSATLSWSGTTATGATYEVQYGAPNFTLGTGTNVTGITTTTTTLSGLNPDTEYCYYVRQNCGTVNGQSAWVGPTCFRTNVLAAANDEPCNAVTATVNQFGNLSGLTGTTIGATTSTGGGLPNSLPACSPTLAPRDVWYRVTLPAGMTSMNAVFSGNAAGMVRLYTATNCSTAFTLVGCQASAGPNTSVGRVTFTGLTAGGTYYVAVSGFGAGDTPGAFTVTAKRNALAGGEVSIFPNPVAGGSALNVRVSGIKPGTVRCEVLNALGQVVLTRSAEVRNGSMEQVLNTQGLAKGMYQVRLTAGSDVVVQKVVVD
ncbi:T9SS type A sorting domain-containing protein [Hymenobacter gummosus]|uniref:T9SS type A sorting domain-containing protein n=1 Tax=Hymenobacter gummosus TaxID=1776032 RepID=A0A3S0QKW4_9BACT|nr:fibronectin type III domain-containing protein [Hymenobacter gummosus]RTQ53357.1 T9SS type A sorting domain-containing protein [Hymenobacter gummosus]